MLNKLKNFVLTGKEKAVAAFLVGTVSSYMAQNGLTLNDLWSKSALWALCVGVASHVVVYFTENGSRS